MNMLSPVLKNVLVTGVTVSIILAVFVSGASYQKNNSNSVLASGGSIQGGVLDILSEREGEAKKGNGNILLIEYSDYECPFCKRFHSVAQALVDGGDVTWVYRHLPLSFHATAEKGAVIGECIRIEKGGDAFWSYTDSIFEADRPSLELYYALAREEGLTETQIESCFQPESEAIKTVSSHADEAYIFGINGTPGSFLVNKNTGEFRRIPGALPLYSEDSVSVSDIIDSLR